MKLLSGSVLLLITLLVACSTPVTVQKDNSINLANYRTYMWVDTRDNESDSKAKHSAFADASIKTAVNNELSKTGWREVKSNPDVLVSYDILVERSVEQRSDPVYSQPFTRVYYNPYTRRYGTIYYPSQFMGYQTYREPVREGTITISMMDAQTDKPVWQAWTTEQLDNRQISGEEIAKSIKNIFRKFDVASK